MPKAIACMMKRKRILIRRDLIFDESNFNLKQEVKVRCTEDEIILKPDESETKGDESPVRKSERSNGESQRK